jgi:hypothetical protein
MVQAEGSGAERRVRRWRSVAEKRRIVELTLEPGASVALVARALIQSDSLLGRKCTGISLKELIHLSVLTHCRPLSSQPPSPAAFPDPLPSPVTRSHGFHHASGTFQPSDY